MARKTAAQRRLDSRLEAIRIADDLRDRFNVKRGEMLPDAAIRAVAFSLDNFKTTADVPALFESLCLTWYYDGKGTPVLRRIE